LDLRKLLPPGVPSWLQAWCYSDMIPLNFVQLTISEMLGYLGAMLPENSKYHEISTHFKLTLA